MGIDSVWEEIAFSRSSGPSVRDNFADVDVGLGPLSGIICGLCVPSTSRSILLSEHTWCGCLCLSNRPDKTFDRLNFVVFGYVAKQGQVTVIPTSESGTGKEPSHVPRCPQAGFLAQAAHHSHHKSCGLSASILPLCAEATQQLHRPSCWRGNSWCCPFWRHDLKVAFSTGLLFLSLWSQQLKKDF